MLAAIVTVIILQLPPPPCIPGVTCPPPPCIPVLTCPPPPLPVPGDDPPKLPTAPVPSWEVGTASTVVLKWEAATDDKGIAGYRIYRDGKLRGLAGKKAVSVKIAMPCGRHSFKIEAVDTAGQRSSKACVVRRRCG